jgi:hypothetical protein
MNVEVEEITVSGEPQWKLRLDGTLFGVFWTKEEAETYAVSLQFNLPGDYSDPRNP